VSATLTLGVMTGDLSDEIDTLVEGGLTEHQAECWLRSDEPAAIVADELDCSPSNVYNGVRAAEKKIEEARKLVGAVDQLE
jgi:hypothetical protein